MPVYKNPLWGMRFIIFEKQMAAMERQLREGPTPSSLVHQDYAGYQQDSTLDTLVHTGRETEAVAYLKTMQCTGFTSGCLNNCLLSAAQNGNRALVEGLLLSKAHVNHGSQDPSTYTALAMAVSEGHVEVASLLLANKAHANYRHPVTLETVLMLTIRSPNCLQMMELLISFGANVNEINASGQSALLLAITEGDAAVVTMLVKHGASLDFPLWMEKTPLQLARRVGLEDAVDAGLWAMMAPPTSRLPDEIEGRHD